MDSEPFYQMGGFTRLIFRLQKLEWVFSSRMEIAGEMVRVANDQVGSSSPPGMFF
jgi:hypothetical protein